MDKELDQSTILDTYFMREETQTQDLSDNETEKQLSDTLGVYLSQVKMYPVLTEEEETKYGKMLLGTKDEREYAKNIFILHNLRLVISVARNYRSCTNLSFEDLIQEGNIGLIKAVEKYDPTIGRFSTYAVWWIKQSVMRSMSDQGRTIRLPVHVIEKIGKILKTQKKLELDGTEATFDRLAEESNLPKEVIEQYYLWSSTPVSLNMRIGTDTDSDSEFGDFVKDEQMLNPEETCIKNEMKQDIYKAMKHLTKKEKDIVIKYYGLETGQPRTLQSLSDEMHITRERVRQIKDKAEKKIKNPARMKYIADYIE